MKTSTFQQTIELSAKALAEFKAKAIALGHDPALLMQGETLISHFTLPTLAACREIMSNVTGEDRIERARHFFNEHLVARSRLGQGMHDRGESILFAEGQMEESDLASLAHHLPIHVKAWSILHKTVPAGEEWDVSARADEWGLSEMEELYTVVNIGTLVLEPGARLVIRGNVLSLLCQQLIVLPGQPQHAYQIGILPTPFPVDIDKGAHHGSDGMNGPNGVDGKHGLPMDLEYSILGAMIRTMPDPYSLDATAGTNGHAGTAGQRGKNGGMCKIAELSIRELNGQLQIFSQAGKGGNGGRGGAGGKGGDGGNGTEGYKGVSGNIRGGRGGNGGHGGAGGRGGHGANGGLASNIYLTVPKRSEHQVSMHSFPSEGGAGGQGGHGGGGGRGGSGGAGKIPEVCGDHGVDGKRGQDGKQGVHGRTRPAAVLYLNEKRIQQPK